MALGGGVGARVLVSGMSETPFSTMLPMSIEALSSLIWGSPVPDILWRGGIFCLPDPLLFRLSMAAFFNVLCAAVLEQLRRLLQVRTKLWLLLARGGGADSREQEVQSSSPGEARH